MVAICTVAVCRETDVQSRTPRADVQLDKRAAFRIFSDLARSCGLSVFIGVAAPHSIVSDRVMSDEVPAFSEGESLVS